MPKRLVINSHLHLLAVDRFLILLIDDKRGDFSRCFVLHIRYLEFLFGADSILVPNLDVDRVFFRQHQPFVVDMNFYQVPCLNWRVLILMDLHVIVFVVYLMVLKLFFLSLDVLQYY